MTPALSQHDYMGIFIWGYGAMVLKKMAADLCRWTIGAVKASHTSENISTPVDGWKIPKHFPKNKLNKIEKSV